MTCKYILIAALLFLGGCGGGDPNPATQYSQRVVHTASDTEGQK